MGKAKGGEGEVEEDGKAGLMEEGRGRMVLEVLFVDELAEALSAELEEEQGGAGLPGVGSGRGEDDLFAGGGEVTFFQHGEDGHT